MSPQSLGVGGKGGALTFSLSKSLTRREVFMLSLSRYFLLPFKSEA